jgi:hypothetical protein
MGGTEEIRLNKREWPNPLPLKNTNILRNGFFDKSLKFNKTQTSLKSE